MDPKQAIVSGHDMLVIARLMREYVSASEGFEVPVPPRKASKYLIHVDAQRCKPRRRPTDLLSSLIDMRGV